MPAFRQLKPAEPPGLETNVGLVGMHIVHKTVPRTTQWIWTSFEHVDQRASRTTDRRPPINYGSRYNL